MWQTVNPKLAKLFIFLWLKLTNSPLLHLISARSMPVKTLRTIVTARRRSESVLSVASLQGVTSNLLKVLRHCCSIEMSKCGCCVLTGLFLWSRCNLHNAPKWWLPNVSSLKATFTLNWSSLKGETIVYYQGCLWLCSLNSPCLMTHRLLDRKWFAFVFRATPPNRLTYLVDDFVVHVLRLSFQSILVFMWLCA